MKIRFLALFLALCMLLSIPALAVPPDGAGQLELLHEVDEVIRSLYLSSDGVSRIPTGLTAQQLQDDPELFGKVMEMLTGQLDDYSGFYTAEEYEYYYPTGDSYVGVGIMLNQYTPYGLFVQEALEGGAALEAGLKPGDQIVEIAGKDVSGVQVDSDEVSLRGEEGTYVDIKVLRPGEKGLLSFRLERRPIYMPNIVGYQIGGDIALIEISQFGSIYDYTDFIGIYEALPDLGVDKIIFDLRDNPGGSLDLLLWILDDLIKGERELFTFYEKGDSETFYSFGNSEWQPDQMVVLVDEWSASASEVFAGALKDLGLAKIVGKTTYGKARAQWHMPFDTEDVLVLTVSTIELVKSGDYEGKGIEPDYDVSLEPELYRLPEGWIELNADYALVPGISSSERVKALEMNLYELGLFHEEPDGEYTWYTQQCVNAAQKALGVPVTATYASKAVLQGISEWIQTLKTANVLYEDAQMDKALELCGWTELAEAS